MIIEVTKNPSAEPAAFYRGVSTWDSADDAGVLSGGSEFEKNLVGGTPMYRQISRCMCDGGGTGSVGPMSVMNFGPVPPPRMTPINRNT